MELEILEKEISTEKSKYYGVGLKINVDTLEENNVTIQQVANIFKSYHNGCYSIGLDTKFVQKPHYHVHFYTDVPFNNISKQKSKYMSYGGRTTKLYKAKELPSADTEVWYAYAVKEKVIYLPSEFDNKEFHAKRLAQLEIKRLKKIKSEEFEIKDKEKKEFKDKLFIYIEQGIEEKSKVQINNYHYVSEHDIDHMVRLLIISYGINNEMYFSKIQIEKYLLEYSCKFRKWTEQDYYNFIYGH